MVICRLPSTRPRRLTDSHWPEFCAEQVTLASDKSYLKWRCNGDTSHRRPHTYDQRDGLKPRPTAWRIVWLIAPILHSHLWLPQNLSQRAAQPPRTIAQLMSPDLGDTHHAPVRSPPARPVDLQRMVGPETRMCPCGPTPVRFPRSPTSASLEAIGSLSGQGCPSEQLPSVSRAAIPEIRSLGPSAHHIGPSPSQTWVGVHSKVSPTGITATCNAIWSKVNIIG
jgi:hypothetical protein